jgi:hypothetical protein
MMPSSLVTIRRYPMTSSTWGGGAGVGADERKVLLEAGIESYVKLDRIGSVVLVVPEAQVDAARRALANSPDLFERHFAPPCPRCHTPHPGPRPPYEMAVVGIGLLAALGVVVADLPIGIAYGLVAVSVVTGAVMYSHLPFWRCHVCGYRYGARADDRGRVVRFPDRRT